MMNFTRLSQANLKQEIPFLPNVLTLKKAVSATMISSSS